MSLWSNLLRRARVRGLKEGQVQSARVEALESDAKDQAERWQDYGFAGNPVDGQGLVINAGGHTIVLRVDRLTERPGLAPLEVCVWHAEGHRVTLKAGRLVHVDCDRLVVNAADGIDLITPVVTVSDTLTGPTVLATSSLQIQGKEMHLHRHSNVSNGPNNSGPPA